MNKNEIKKYALLSMLSAMAYVSLYLIRFPIIPSASFLSCDIKDVMLLMGAYLYGPIYGFWMAIIVSLIQMLTISQYGIIGLIMNVCSSTAFVCTAASLYRKKPNTLGLIAGLTFGCLSMTVTMLLWNYLVTPLYMNVSRETVRSMLLPIFLPFNLIKSFINAVLSFAIYKGVIERLKTMLYN